MKDKNLEFYGILDFYPKKEIILSAYKRLPIKDRKIYKMYVYSTCFETEETKDLIWEYLNGWEESQKELFNQYIVKLKKVEKRK